MNLCINCDYWQTEDRATGRCDLLSKGISFVSPADFGCNRFKPKHDPFLDRPVAEIAECSFNIRAYRVFVECGAVTLRDVLALGKHRIGLARNCGRLTVAHIEQELAKIGVRL